MADISGFHDVQFPTGIAMGAVGGAGFKTDVIEFVSGKEQRNVRWTAARMAWDVAHAIKTQDEMNQLVAFFRNRRGKAYGFRFKDWTDFECVGGDGYFATGDGVSKTFQLSKYYSDAGSFNANEVGSITQRPITRPIASTVQITLGSNVVAGWTLDDTTGLVTFAGTPALGVEMYWTGEFDVPVRFDTDQMKLTMDDYNILSWGSIPLIELKEV